MSVTEIQESNKKLKELIDQKKFDAPELKRLLKLLKIMIFKIPNLPAQSPQFLIEARVFVESNLFYSLIKGNTKQIELAIDNVRFFYENQFGLPKSSNHEAIKAIHLLSLLSSHRNEEFYTKVENLEAAQLSNNLIQYVLKVNDAIEEGNYRKVFTLKKDSPLQFFKPFLDRVQDTIRIELAKSAEKAYTVLSISEAQNIFQVDGEQNLLEFIKSYTSEIEEPTVNWLVRDGKIFFERSNLHNIKFNSEDLIQKSLEYAEELERIA